MIQLPSTFDPRLAWRAAALVLGLVVAFGLLAAMLRMLLVQATDRSFFRYKSPWLYQIFLLE